MELNHQVEITPFQKNHQNGVDKLMAAIATEFPQPIFSPTSKKIKDVFTIPTNKFWVALSGNQVIGTIGLQSLSNDAIMLKSMFLAQDFRGLGISQSLLAVLQKWCGLNGFTTIYLGTMEQFIAAHKFYEKNGFRRINQNDLPVDFVTNPVDTIFYKLVLL